MSVDGVHMKTVAVSGVPDLYTLVSSASYRSGHSPSPSPPG